MFPVKHNFGIGAVRTFFMFLKLKKRCHQIPHISRNTSSHIIMLIHLCLTLALCVTFSAENGVIRSTCVVKGVVLEARQYVQ